MQNKLEVEGLKKAQSDLCKQIEQAEQRIKHTSDISILSATDVYKASRLLDNLHLHHTGLRMLQQELDSGRCPYRQQKLPQNTLIASFADGDACCCKDLAY